MKLLKKRRILMALMTVIILTLGNGNDYEGAKGVSDMSSSLANVPKLSLYIDYYSETAVVSMEEYPDSIPNLLYSFDGKSWNPLITGYSQMGGSIDISKKIGKKPSIVYVKIDGLDDSHKISAVIKARRAVPSTAAKGNQAVKYDPLTRTIELLEPGYYEYFIAENAPVIVEAKAGEATYIDCGKYGKCTVLLRYAATASEFVSKEAKIKVNAPPKAPKLSFKNGLTINGLSDKMEYSYFTEDIDPANPVGSHWCDWRTPSAKSMEIGTEIPKEATMLIARLVASSKNPPSQIVQIDLRNGHIMNRVTQPGDPIFNNYEVTFKNPQIEASVRSYIMSGGNPENMQPAAPILKSHLPQISTLSVSGANGDLSDLVHLTNIEELTLSGSYITDLSPLKNLTKLHTLTINGIGTSDIGVLAKLNKLKQLQITGVALSDLRPLERLPHLQSLDVSSNNITDISCLSGIKTLRILDLRSNPLSDINPLRTHTALEYLNLARTGITDIRSLVDLTSLVWLDLSNNNLRTNDFSTQTKPLGGLIRLQILDMSNTGISDLTGLGKLSNLRELYLMNNPIGEVENPDMALAPLKGLKNILMLDLTNTKIRTTNGINGNQSLTTLILSNNPDLTDINLGQMKNLTELRVNGCGLTTANEPQLYALRNLYYLDVSGNRNQLFASYTADPSLGSNMRDTMTGSPTSYDKQLVFNMLDFGYNCTPSHGYSAYNYSYTISLRTVVLTQGASSSWLMENTSRTRQRQHPSGANFYYASETTTYTHTYWFGVKN